jgi:hypothetical protein
MTNWPSFLVHKLWRDTLELDEGLTWFRTPSSGGVTRKSGS